MRLPIRSFFAAALVAVCSCPSASAGSIFDNTGNATGGSTTTSGAQLGDEVTAAGTDRSVTEVEIGFKATGQAATADLQAFLYANDGSGGAPGTLLWSSAIMTGVSLSTQGNLIAFAVPNIVVPDTFTLTASITNPSSTVGWVPSSAATTGTWIQTWVGAPGAFGALTDPAFQVESRVIAGAAVPEPGSIALCAIGLGCVLLRWRFSRRRSTEAAHQRLTAPSE